MMRYLKYSFLIILVLVTTIVGFNVIKHKYKKNQILLVTDFNEKRTKYNSVKSYLENHGYKVSTVELSNLKFNVDFDIATEKVNKIAQQQEFIAVIGFGRGAPVAKLATDSMNLPLITVFDPTELIITQEGGVQRSILFISDSESIDIVSYKNWINSVNNQDWLYQTGQRPASVLWITQIFNPTDLNSTIIEWLAENSIKP